MPTKWLVIKSKWYGLGGMLGIIGRMMRLYLSNPDYWQLVQKTKEKGILPKNFETYFGYILYIGKK